MPVVRPQRASGRLSFGVSWRTLGADQSPSVGNNGRWGLGRYCEAMAGRALLRFKTLPRTVQVLWMVTAFVAFNVSVRFVS